MRDDTPPAAPGLAYAHGLHIADAAQLSHLLDAFECHRAGRRYPLTHTAQALRTPEVVRAFVDGLDGPFGLTADTGDVEAVRAFAGAVLARASVPVAGAHVVFGRCAEATGELRVAEAHVRDALDADPRVAVARCDVGLYAAMAGDLARARRCFEKAGVPVEGFAAAVTHRTCYPPDPSLGFDPLLYIKLGAWIRRPHVRRRMLPLTMATAGVSSYGEAAEVVHAAVLDEDLGDIHLFDDSGVDAALADLTPLLPRDEAAALARLARCRHRVWEVLERPDGHQPWRVRDTVSGEVVQVADMPGAPRSWRAGTRLWAPLVPADGDGRSSLLIGTVRALDDTRARELERLVAQGASAAALAVAMVGPALPAASTARELALDLLAGTRDRVTWLFPEARLELLELADLEVIDRWTAQTYLEDEDREIDPFVHMTIRQMLMDEPHEVWTAGLMLERDGYDRKMVVHILAALLWGALCRAEAGDDFEDAHVDLLTRVPARLRSS